MGQKKRAAAEEAFRAGAERHQSGDFAAAEAAYRQALSLAPDHAEAVHMMGILAHQTGRSELAVDLLRRATALKPSFGHYHNNLGGVLRDMGRAREAVIAYRKALSLQPNHPQVHRNLGCALADQDQFERAAESFRTALRLDPAYVDAMGDLGSALDRQGRSAEALVWFNAALQLSPADPKLHNNMGMVFRALDRSADAAACFREAVRLRGDYAIAWANLGNMLQELGQADAARECLNRAVSLEPRSVDAAVNLGAALYLQRRLDDALSAFHRGLEVAPDSADLMWNLSQAALAMGDFQTGWQAFEARWRTAQLSWNWHKSSAPTWTGQQNPAGKTILLFAEQGYGDTIQFVRYAPLLAERGATVLLLVQPALASLVARMPGVAAVFTPDDKLPRYDLQCAMMSLPLAFGTQLDSIPAGIPYLDADSSSVSAWKARVASLPGLKVGLVWAGDPRPDQPDANRVDRRRSLHFDQLSPLADIAGVSFVSLQKGSPAAQARKQAPGLALHDWTDELQSFADTAALTETLDLVISVDTAMAHLAGAVGRPVWMLNRFDSCWRWLEGRDDSPWYPNLRQFRQTTPGDWGSVLARVRGALETLSAANARNVDLAS